MSLTSTITLVISGLISWHTIYRGTNIMVSNPIKGHKNDTPWISFHKHSAVAIPSDCPGRSRLELMLQLSHHFFHLEWQLLQSSPLHQAVHAAHADTSTLTFTSHANCRRGKPQSRHSQCYTDSTCQCQIPQNIFILFDFYFMGFEFCCCKSKPRVHIK